MIKEKDIIKGLKQLKTSIKVDQTRVNENRAELLAYYKEKFPSTNKDLFFYFKPALALVAALFIFTGGSLGVLAYAGKSLPGDQLYVFKRLQEKITYQLTANDKKPVLHAELLEKRLAEVKSLVEKNPVQDSTVPSVVKEAAGEIKKEVAALKKEINPNTSESIAPGNLPILDDQKVLKMIASQQDINKLLADTKEALKENNLSIASEKISELEKVFEEPKQDDNLTNEKQNSTNSNPEIINQGQVNEKETNLEIKPIVPQPEPDFKIDLEKEQNKLESFQEDLSN